MIRRLLCLLGFHEWKTTYQSYCYCPSTPCPYRNKKCGDCIFYKLYSKECKHCGAIKR